MKKMNVKYIIACTLAVCTGMSACDGIWSENSVPEAVKAKFVTHYPTIKQVDWELTNGLYEAEFEISGRQRIALFQEDGSLLSYKEEIEERFLPDHVLEILQDQFADFQVDEVYRVKKGGQTTYQVELEDNAQEKLLHFDESGELLEESILGQHNTPQQQSASLLPGATSGNNLGEAKARWELPNDLKEVSGIALLSDGLMACVQDEEGAIFLYDLDKRQIVEKIPFAAPGDYEGLAVVKNTAYVLRSDGSLFEVADFRAGNTKAILHKGDFPVTINMEGLAYDEQNDRLLLASKGFDKKLGPQKGIYAFSLADKKMQSEAIITIPLTQVNSPKKSKKGKSGYDVLQPSSLEVHPVTGELYLLDAVHNRLYTLNQKGEIVRTIALDKNMLQQAEGLTFAADGSLYIASEGGKKGKGNIVKYTGEV